MRTTRWSVFALRVSATCGSGDGGGGGGGGGGGDGGGSGGGGGVWLVQQVVVGFGAFVQFKGNRID